MRENLRSILVIKRLIKNEIDNGLNQMRYPKTLLPFMRGLTSLQNMSTMRIYGSLK